MSMLLPFYVCSVLKLLENYQWKVGLVCIMCYFIFIVNIRDVFFIQEMSLLPANRKRRWKRMMFILYLLVRRMGKLRRCMRPILFVLLMLVFPTEFLLVCCKTVIDLMMIANFTFNHWINNSQLNPWYLYIWLIY